MYQKKHGVVPKTLCFAMACLIYFYGKNISSHQYQLKDDKSNILFFSEIWKDLSIEKIVEQTLGNVSMWDQNLSKNISLKENVTNSLKLINSHKNVIDAYNYY